MIHRSTRYLVAALQAILGWEWFMSGSNKLLAGDFPAGLADALKDGLKDNPNSWYVNFINNTIIPHSVFYGYLIEWSEVIIGIILLGGALMLLFRPLKAGEEQHRIVVGYCSTVILAAAVAIFQNINFHFWAGGWVLPGFNAAAPFNEGIDLDALLPPLFLLVIIANAHFIRELRGGRLFPAFHLHIGLPHHHTTQEA